MQSSSRETTLSSASGLEVLRACQKAGELLPPTLAHQLAHHAALLRPPLLQGALRELLWGLDQLSISTAGMDFPLRPLA